MCTMYYEHVETYAINNKRKGGAGDEWNNHS